MRLIDADELIEFIEDRYEVTWESDTYEGGIKDACTDILEKIDNMPTIEPRTGKWLETNVFQRWECSECGEITMDAVMGEPRANYCPNCGARMEG